MSEKFHLKFTKECEGIANNLLLNAKEGCHVLKACYFDECVLKAISKKLTRREF